MGSFTPLPPSVNVIGTSLDGEAAGFGWALDGRIVTEVLREAGFRVNNIDAHFYWGEGRWNDIRARLAREALGVAHRFRPRADINLFLERIVPQLFPAARQQVLIPNQEWFPAHWQKHLEHIDLVLCKTRVAEEIFSRLGCRTAFSSFTTPDRRLLPRRDRERNFVMITGKRPGLAARTLRLWQRHPEWPDLTLTGRWIPAGLELPNARLIRDYLPEKEIRVLQNTHRFHLAVTAAEGFGHKFTEAFSCEAIVLATDAPPMNEVVQVDRGFLVGWNRSNPKTLGTEYHFDDVALEKTIEQCRHLTDAEIERLSRNARAWYQANDAAFRERLPLLLRTLVANAAP